MAKLLYLLKQENQISSHRNVFYSSTFAVYDSYVSWVRAEPGVDRFTDWAKSFKRRGEVIRPTEL